jgi:hypothetical protein
VTRPQASWYHVGITGPISPEFQQRYMAVTRRDAMTSVCARGDLNRVRPTLVLTELGSLSVK